MREGRVIDATIPIIPIVINVSANVKANFWEWYFMLPLRYFSLLKKKIGSFVKLLNKVSSGGGRFLASCLDSWVFSFF